MLPALLGPFGFTVAVAGIRGGLGRELAAQALDRGMHVVGLVRPGTTSDPVYAPNRQGWLSDTRVEPTLSSPELVLHETSEWVNYDALVLCMSGRPFREDTSAEATEEICARLPPACGRVVLVSAHGVGSSRAESNLGIRVMADWYLKETYTAKERQEAIVRGLRGVETRILRPKVLSFGHVPLNTIYTRREDLAGPILDFCSGVERLGFQVEDDGFARSTSKN